MKRISVIISIVALIAIAYWAFHAFVNKQNFVFDPLSVVPEDALLIAELHSGGKEAANFYQRSMVWKDFEETPFAKESEVFFMLLDSLEEYNNIVVSLHKGDGNNTLITISDPKHELQKLLIKYGAKKDKVASSFIYSFPGIPYLFDVQDEYIQIAKSRDLLIRSKSYIEQERSILNDSTFTAVRPGLESGNDLKLFINLKEFTQSINKTIIEDIYDFPGNLSGWLATDLYDKANTIVSSGFLSYNEKSDNFFKAFEGQIAQGLHYFDVIPANTAILTASGYSNPGNYLKALNISEEKRKYFSSWLGNAYGSGVLNGDDRSLSELRFAFFELRDLESFNEHTINYLDQGFTPYPYKEFTINKLDSLFSFKGFEEGISTINRPYFCILSNYVIYSSSEETLKEILKRYSNDNTLSLQESFSNLRDELSDETNYLFYISPAMANSFLKKELADSLRNYWLPQEDKINTLQALIVQVSSYKKGKMYVHSALRHQVVNFQEKDNSLWEVYLDQPIKGNIHLLRNHYTQHLEIAVQDSSHTLFILNNKGEILFEKALDGQIIGDIEQLDMYKNGKLQLLFNTAGTLYCMDRKGNDLEKFPLTFSEKTNLALSLFDYDSNKNYRILIPFPSGELIMYDIEGNEVKGWKFDKVRSAISESAQHFRIGKKDFIYTSTSNGSILLLDRKGKTRYKVKENIGDKNGAANIYTGRSIAASGIYYIDSLGTVVHLPFGGEKEYLAIKGEKGDKLYMARLNEDNSREFMLYNQNKISVSDVNGNKLFDKIIVADLASTPKVYRFGQQNWLGYSDKSTGEAYLRDHNGLVRSDAPFEGIGPFKIGDINKDGILELVIQGSRGQLVVYSLSK
jgi:hypothetical protein